MERVAIAQPKGVTPKTFSALYPRDQKPLYEVKLRGIDRLRGGRMAPAAERARVFFLADRGTPGHAHFGARGAHHTVVELAVETGVPDILDFVVSADYMTSSGRDIKQISRIAF
jgi:hypothetical protein